MFKSLKKILFPNHEFTQKKLDGGHQVETFSHLIQKYSADVTVFENEVTSTLRIEIPFLPKYKATQIASRIDSITQELK